MGQRADIMVGMGRAEEALALVDQALSLQPPNAPIASYIMGSRCHAYMALGRYEDAIAACEKDASLADSWVPHVYLVAGYALLGNVAKVEAEKAKLLAQRTGFSIADFRALGISDVPAYLQQTETHLYAGLRKAGIPDK
jgi:tetratricopeptide (TPR) repeat protein